MYSFWSYNLSDKLFSKMCMNHIIYLIIQKSVVLRQTRWFDSARQFASTAVSVCLWCVCIHSQLTRRDSRKEEAWYWAYLMMVVCERLLSQRHIFLLPLGSQFSSVGWANWVRTSTRWSGLASTSVLVENRPRSVHVQRKQEEPKKVSKYRQGK